MNELIKKFKENVRFRYRRTTDYFMIFRKKYAVERNLNKIKTMVVGSSHGLFAYYTQPREDFDDINLCLPSQDLYYSWKLYEKFFSQMPNLKNIVIFYSVFSPGNDVSKTADNYRCLQYKQAFGIKPIEKSMEKKIFIDEIKYYFSLKNLRKKIVYDDNYNGCETYENVCNIPNLPYTYIQRAFKNFKHNVRDNLQIQYLKNMINSAKEQHYNIYLVISPATDLYKFALPCSDFLFRDIDYLKTDNQVKIIDLWNTDIFEENDFYDYDHVNENGALKSTKIIREIIEADNGSC